MQKCRAGRMVKRRLDASKPVRSTQSAGAVLLGKCDATILLNHQSPAVVLLISWYTKSFEYAYRRFRGRQVKEGHCNLDFDRYVLTVILLQNSVAGGSDETSSRSADRSYHLKVTPGSVA